MNTDTLTISSILHDNVNIDILPKSLQHTNKNKFTVIVGKNGVGKSRLLTNIASKGRSLSTELDYWTEDNPPLVIAISTSPFDKFPPTPKGAYSKERIERSGYRYVGMRGEGLYGASSAISLISSASRGLLEKILSDQNNANFIEVFNSLSFSPKISFVFKPSFSKLGNSNPKDPKFSVSYFIVDTPDLVDTFKVDTRYRNSFERLTTEERSDASYAMANVAMFFDERKALILEMDLASNSSYLANTRVPPHIIRSILLLMTQGLIRLSDLRLEKLDFGELSLKTASSGEQCLVALILGIAGHIRDGSLVLIDEPEISLHPRWQEEFMPLLEKSFSRYKHCQFIIATHSPQVVSNTPPENAYILSLASKELYKSKDFQNKSADYQLAELFDAPGIMNEYISRICFDLIAILRTRKATSKDTAAALSKLKNLKNKLEKDDPITKLITSAEELHKHYASNQ